jgi:hypothetical protein
LEAGGTFTRRALLQKAALVAALSAAPLSLSGAAGAASEGDRRPGSGRGRPLTRSTFVPLLGSTFRVSGAGARHDVVLAEIDDLLPADSTGSENRFSLVFSCSPNRPRVEGIRTFHNDAIGDFDMFVAPIDRGAKALRLQSIINRI